MITSIFAGLVLGIPAEQVVGSVETGMGKLMGDLLIIITTGAMLGKLVAESGAAQRIADFLMRLFGAKYIHWAMMLTGLVVGIPLFYNVGFILLVPLVFTVAHQYKLSAVYVGIPLLAALSVTHGFLPPHPSPAALVAQFDADMGITLMYGLIIAIPTILVAGPWFARFFKNTDAQPLKSFRANPKPVEELPGVANSFFTALLPVFLLVGMTIWNHSLVEGDEGYGLSAFFSNPSVVMLLSLLVAIVTLGLRQNQNMKQLTEWFVDAVKDVSMIILIVAGAGALKQVLIDSGVSEVIASALDGWDVHPLILAWSITALIRVCVGSATVAGLTTAGIIAPVMHAQGVDPNLLVLAIGAGSLMFSHFNDSGFWMYKEFFNLSIKDTIKSWSLMETIVAVVGLGGVMVLEFFVS
ncbi:gluconate transporter [Echinicola pacifica]|uniref:Gluconate transporter n=2 Tax=Echinicola pacifica TaxID=346377 RepID=A0A918Q0B8_9BACT|nr:gluconate transporter [Echinicola pacifica]